MASRIDPVRARLESLRGECVTEAVFLELVSAFPEVKLRALRKAVRESGLPMDAVVEGVRQSSFEELERTLTALARAYEAGARQQTRAMVLESKAHARFASRRNPDKEEMAEWMLVWLEDPALFETWARLRMRARQR